MKICNNVRMKEPGRMRTLSNRSEEFRFEKQKESATE